MTIAAAGPPIGFVSVASSAHRATTSADRRVQPRQSTSRLRARPASAAISSTSGLQIALAWLTIGSSGVGRDSQQARSRARHRPPAAAEHQPDGDRPQDRRNAPHRVEPFRVGVQERQQVRRGGDEVVGRRVLPRDQAAVVLLGQVVALDGKRRQPASQEPQRLAGAKGQVAGRTSPRPSWRRRSAREASGPERGSARGRDALDVGEVRGLVGPLPGRQRHRPHEASKQRREHDEPDRQAHPRGARRHAAESRRSILRAPFPHQEPSHQLRRAPSRHDHRDAAYGVPAPAVAPATPASGRGTSPATARGSAGPRGCGRRRCRSRSARRDRSPRPGTAASARRRCRARHRRSRAAGRRAPTHWRSGTGKPILSVRSAIERGSTRSSDWRRTCLSWPFLNFTSAGMVAAKSTTA